mgnify:CR=1 FL=1
MGGVRNDRTEQSERERLDRPDHQDDAHAVISRLDPAAVDIHQSDRGPGKSEDGPRGAHDRMRPEHLQQRAGDASSDEQEQHP